LEVEDGTARLVDRKKRVDRSDFMYLAFVESQDFRPPDERELLFTAYAYKGGEVMGIDLESGELTNYSHDWAYDEAEGVFPDGESIAAERELNTYTANPIGDIDIWQLTLDGSGVSRRLTHFTEYDGFGANNPVISPDGKKMAFGLRIKGGGHGNAQGILLYDFEKAPR
jgi:Tol biopolymer transport system component